MESQARAVIVLFRGDPRREERQKRLPRCFLSTLHVALLKTIRGLAGVDVLIARDVGDEFRVGDRHWRLDSLAARIDATIEYTFSRGYSRVLLLAGDIFDVRCDDLRLALQALDSPARRAVIGLSGDGGFFAVGFSQQPALDWSRLLRDRQCAGAALNEAVRAHGFAISMLTPVDDVDDRADAERLVRLRQPSRKFLRLLAELESMLCSVAIPPPFAVPRREAALAFSSTFRGPPDSRRPF